MGTIKATLRKRGIIGDDYPIVIRVIHDRASAEMRVENFRVKENQWDESKQQVNPNKCRRAAVINSAIRQAIRPLEDAHDSLALSGQSFTVNDIKELASSKSNNKSTGSFAEYMDEYIKLNPDELRYGTMTYYKSTLMRWKEFDPSVKTSDLKESHIVGFRKYLLDVGNNTNTIYNRMKTVRKMVKRAMRLGLLKKDPFTNFTSKQVKGERASLTREELNRVIEYMPKHPGVRLAKDVFVFACHTGLRFGDICRLSKSNLEMNHTTHRLTFRMGKTSDIVSFKLSKTANDIVERHLQKEDNLVFPMLRSAKGTSIDKNIASQNALLNRYLKGIMTQCEIHKSISMHCGRHTFAVNSLTMGGDIYVLSKFLGHTSLSTTEIYAKAVDKRKDELTELWNKNGP